MADREPEGCDELLNAAHEMCLPSEQIPHQRMNETWVLREATLREIERMDPRVTADLLPEAEDAYFRIEELQEMIEEEAERAENRDKAVAASLHYVAEELENVAEFMFLMTE